MITEAIVRPGGKTEIVESDYNPPEKTLKQRIDKALQARQEGYVQTDKLRGQVKNEHDYDLFIFEGGGGGGVKPVLEEASWREAVAKVKSDNPIPEE